MSELSTVLATACRSLNAAHAAGRRLTNEEMASLITVLSFAVPRAEAQERALRNLAAQERRIAELEAIAADLDLISHAKSGALGPVEVTPAGLAALGVGPPMGELVDLAPALLREQRAALAARQRELQAALDAGDEEALSELCATGAVKDLADLVIGAEPACRRGEVVILPVVQRVRRPHGARPQDGGDAA
jgi:hypothetical protein